MVVAERVYQSVLQLPEPFQAEVLNFTEYLLLKAQQAVTPEDENAWPSLSLTLAMRGIEDEDTPEYTLTDVKEQFTSRDGALSSPAHSTIERFRGEQGRDRRRRADPRHPAAKS